MSREKENVMGFMIEEQETHINFIRVEDERGKYLYF